MNLSILSDINLFLKCRNEPKKYINNPPFHSIIFLYIFISNFFFIFIILLFLLYLLTKERMKLYFILSTLFIVARALPIATPVEEEAPQCPTTNYDIPVERFAQLISTHLQFDHLDSILTSTYRTISNEFQKHIQVTIEDSPQPSTNTELRRQHSFKRISSWDVMDLELLQAQIFGAIQAHTEGNLPVAWDRLADKLGRQALESFVRNTTLSFCKSPDTEEQLLSSVCLQEKADEISDIFDNYVSKHLDAILTELDQNVLPDLLTRTSKDLSDVLNYFNKLFSSNNNQHLYLKVIPWEEGKTSIKNELKSTLSSKNDEHLVDFFANYACLSRI